MSLTGTLTTSFTAPATAGSRVLAGAAPVLAAGWAVHALAMRRRVRAARLDPLTGLLTRTGWTNQAERIIRAGDGVVVLLDLDRFKQINDTFGHDAGDAVLVATADRLSAWCARTGGVAGRLGGDEFVAAGRTRSGIRQLCEDLQQPVITVAAPISVSMGIARVAHAPQADLSELLRQADAAMYQVKANGGGDYQADGRLAVVQSTSGDARRWGRRATKGSPELAHDLRAVAS